MLRAATYPAGLSIFSQYLPLVFTKQMTCTVVPAAAIVPTIFEPSPRCGADRTCTSAIFVFNGTPAACAAVGASTSPVAAMAATAVTWERRLMNPSRHDGVDGTPAAHRGD